MHQAGNINDQAGRSSNSDGNASDDGHPPAVRKYSSALLMNSRLPPPLSIVASEKLTNKFSTSADTNLVEVVFEK